MSMLEHLSAMPTAETIMHSQYRLVDGLLTVAEGIDVMRKHNVNVLIIQPRDATDEHGIVLATDIAKKVLAANRSTERVSLYEIMTKPVISVRPEMSIRNCARLFGQFGLSLAPVTNQQHQVLGIVDYSCIVTGWASS